MSHQAIVWALKQPVKPAPAKHILTVMAHYVSATQGGPWVAFPSVTQLAKDTGQDRKTVMVNLKRLEESGYIIDTGEREGVTKSVPVYQLSAPSSSTNSGTPSGGQSSTETGIAYPPEAVPNPAPLSSTKNGTASKEGSSTNFSGKQYQIPPEAVPDFPTEQVEQVLGTGEVKAAASSPTRTCAHTRETESPLAPAKPSTPIPDEAATRAAQLAVILRRNGADPRTHSGSKGIAELVEMNATDAQALNALETGKQRRKASGSSQPVNAAYLVPIVRDLQTQSKPKPGGRYAEDLRQMREMSAWADEQILNSRGHPRPAIEIEMGAIDATRHD